MSDKNKHAPVLRRKKSNLVSNQYRRRSKATLSDQYQAKLTHVLGLTLKNNSSFTCDPNSGLLAYPAGCVIVLFNPRTEKQSHIFNPGQKTLTCMRFSDDGTLIVTGESGHQPCVRVFSVQDKSQVSCFSSHKFGISCVSFSPNSKYAISIGHQHDMLINVWDLKRNTLAASNKVSTKIKSVAFAEDGSYFVTVGTRLVKFWYLDNSSEYDKTPFPLKGRPALLESLQNHMFCDVVCAVGMEFTFAVTKSGILCQFTEKRTIKKHIQLECSSARCLAIFEGLLLCGCAQGCIHIFELETLNFIKEITPPTELGPSRNEILAMSVDVRNFWLHCVYADHSVLVYDMMDTHSPDLNYLSQYHNSCVYDVKMLPYSSECSTLPTDCFITCSSDGTARAWTYTNTYKLLKIIKLEESAEQLNGNTEVDGSKMEARSLCVRHDGKHLAVGDKTGNIHIFDLETFEKVSFIPTHEGDVLGLDYLSPPGGMLASASRDRCVHTFVGDGYAPTHTITDHSAAVSAIKFARKGSKVRLITCGADKSLYFCAVTTNPSSGKVAISREQHIVEKNSMVDMCVLDDSVLVACGSFLREYEIMGGKLKRSFRGSETTQPLLQVAVDDQRTMVATSCSDKKIYILGFVTTECMCTLSGHSENVVSLAFDLHGHLLSASADSCIFVWELNHRVAIDIKALNHTAPSSALTTPETDLNKTDYFGEVETSVNLIDDGFNNTPRSVSSDAPHVDPDDLAYPLEMGSHLSSELPSWVLNHGKEGAFNGAKPASTLGSWGNGLQQDEICEQLGKLASDQISVLSFVEEFENSDTDDISSVEGEIALSLAEEFKVFQENSSIIDSINKEINLSLEEINQKTEEETSNYAELPEKNSKIDPASDLDLLPVKEGKLNVFENLEDSLNNEENVLIMEGKNKENLSDNADNIEVSILNRENIQKSSILNEEAINCSVLNDKNSEKVYTKKDNVVHKNEYPVLITEDLVHGNEVVSDTLITCSESESKSDTLKPIEHHNDTFIIPPENKAVLTNPNQSDSITCEVKLEPNLNPTGNNNDIQNPNPSNDISSVSHTEPSVNRLDPVSSSNHFDTPANDPTSVIDSAESGLNRFEATSQECDEYVDMRGHHYKRPEDIHKNDKILTNGVENSKNAELSDEAVLLFEKAIDAACERIVSEVVTSAENDCVNEYLSQSKSTASNQTKQPDIKTYPASQTIDTMTSQVPIIKIQEVVQNGDVIGKEFATENGELKKDNPTHNFERKVSEKCNDSKTDKNVNDVTENGENPPTENGIKTVTENGIKTPIENGFADRRTDLPTKQSGISLPSTPSHARNSQSERNNTDPRSISGKTNPRFLTPKSSSKGDVIHPGFAELLASLTKLKTRRSPARIVSVRKIQQEEIKTGNVNGMESGDHSFKERLCVDRSGYTNRNTSLESNTSSMSSNSSNTSDGYYTVLNDCQKASRDLLASFNQAKELYHKQKAQTDIDHDYSRNSINKLLAAFRTVHQGITDMDLVDSDLPIRPSLNTLKDGSPGMFLLREYSELLFDMIKNRVESKVAARDNDI